MISVFTIICLYACGFLVMGIPLAFALILKIKYNCKLVKFALLPLGLSIVAEMLINPLIIEMILSAFTPSITTTTELYPYWQENLPLAYIAITVGCETIFTFLCAFIPFKIFKNELRVYDATMFGLFYPVINAISTTISIGSYASISIHNNNGTLSELVSENYTLESLQEYVQVIQNTGALTALSDLLHIIEIIAASILLSIFAFHAIKSKKYYFIAFGALIYAGAWALPQIFSIYVSDYILLSILLAVLSALMVVGVFLYYKWYKQQQQILAQQMAEYKEHIRKI